MQSLLDATQPKGRRYYRKSEYLPRIDTALSKKVVQHADVDRSFKGNANESLTRLSNNTFSLPTFKALNSKVFYVLTRFDSCFAGVIWLLSEADDSIFSRYATADLGTCFHGRGRRRTREVSGDLLCDNKRTRAGNAGLSFL